MAISVWHCSSGILKKIDTGRTRNECTHNDVVSVGGGGNPNHCTACILPPARQFVSRVAYTHARVSEKKEGVSRTLLPLVKKVHHVKGEHMKVKTRIKAGALITIEESPSTNLQPA